MRSKESQIKRIRIAKGISQADMAEQLHMSQSGYAKLENGQTKLDVDRLIKISSILEIDFNELLATNDNVALHNYNPSYSNIAYHQNIYSDLKENYEKRIMELQVEIKFLRDCLKNNIEKK